MDAFGRLQSLSAMADIESAEDAACPQLSDGKLDRLRVSQAVLPNGRRIRLLKTLLTSACERNCPYCPFRAGRDYRRLTFRPEELARTFMAVHQAGLVQGLFLSSGVVAGGVHTQDKVIASADILRNRLGYRGYLHLKIMPGADHDQVVRTMELADRVSVNLEAPNPGRLESLAPGKVFLQELLQPLRWVEEVRRTHSPAGAWGGRWPSSTTQYVVGALGESDLELLQTTEYLHRRAGLARAYFSAFRPVPDTPLAGHRPTPAKREQRLYQASFLLRDYGFRLEDLPFEAGGNLPLDTDPKLAWAQAHLRGQPVEINNATRNELLRVPGIGQRGADLILASRQGGRLLSLEALGRMGIQARRAAPYVLLDGRRPAMQLALL